ncbi:MAG: CIA30 family protein [Acidimicrobiales bacterium]
MAKHTAKFAALQHGVASILLGVLLAGCSSVSSAGNDSRGLDQTAQSSTTPPTTITQPTHNATEDPDMNEPTRTNSSSECVRLTDFTTEAERQAWQTVNDNVMGGQSEGGPTFGDGLMVFSGETNTDGGGFSSLRLPLAPDALSDFERVTVRARPDGRDYMITFDDNVSSRDRRVSHRAPLGFEPTGDWQEVSVSFGDLFPALFGRPVDDLPFDKTLATRMGIMISDGRDGPFRLEIDWIDLCR